MSHKRRFNTEKNKTKKVATESDFGHMKNERRQYGSLIEDESGNEGSVEQQQQNHRKANENISSFTWILLRDANKISFKIFIDLERLQGLDLITQMIHFSVQLAQLAAVC